MGDTLRTEAVQGPVCLFSGIQEDKIAKMRDKFRGKHRFPVGRIGTRTAANRGRIGTEVTNTCPLGEGVFVFYRHFKPVLLRVGD